MIPNGSEIVGGELARARVRPRVVRGDGALVAERAKVRRRRRGRQRLAGRVRALAKVEEVLADERRASFAEHPHAHALHAKRVRRCLRELHDGRVDVAALERLRTHQIGDERPRRAEQRLRRCRLRADRSFVRGQAASVTFFSVRRLHSSHAFLRKVGAGDRARGLLVALWGCHRGAARRRVPRRFDRRRRRGHRRPRRRETAGHAVRREGRIVLHGHAMGHLPGGIRAARSKRSPRLRSRRLVLRAGPFVAVHRLGSGQLRSAVRKHHQRVVLDHRGLARVPQRAHVLHRWV